MIKLGNSNIGKIYLGSTAIGKAYFGSNLVYSSDSGPGPQPTMIPYIRGGADGSYIDTGITPDNTTRVIVWARNFNPYGGIIFGSRVAYQNQAFALSANGYSQSGLITIQYGNVAIDASSGDHFRYLGGYHKYEMQPISVSVDDAQLFTGSGSFSGNSLNLHLFGINNGGTHTSTFSPMDICACQIYKEGILVRDFTAVNTPSVGFYDAVSQTLFTNAGSGSFIYGEFDKNSYTPLEYVECSSAQRFDTGVKGTYSLPIVTKIRSTNTTLSWMGYMGVFSSDPASCCSFTFGTAAVRNGQISMRLGAATSDVRIYTNGSSSVITDQDIVILKNNNVGYVYKNRTQLGTGTKTGVDTTFETNLTMYVGATRKTDTTTVDSYFQGRIYYLGLGAYRSFVPAKKGTKIGMYDTYNDIFYQSETSTPFIAGPTI